MESKASRKEAIAKFKEIKPLRGVFAIRCTVTGHVWVGTSPNLNATKNREWTTLRLGCFRDSSLQREWNSNGEQAFTYDIVESLDEDTNPLNVPDLLKAKCARWVGELGAVALL